MTDWRDTTLLKRAGKVTEMEDEAVSEGEETSALDSISELINSQ